MQKSKLLLSLAGCVALLEIASAQSNTNLDLARRLNQAFVEVAEKVSPSVVVITVTEKPVEWPALPDPDGTNATSNSAPRDFWRRFHEQFENELPDQGQGSGVIIREDGYILTSNHVLENAEQIEVRLRSGKTFKAIIRGSDPQSDVAVIKIEADHLPVARMADSSRTRVGEFAIAIGAPFNYDYSVTFGHVSAKGRSHVVPALEGGAMMDQDYIQTDANINPGNSGGPLLNIDGEVIGINTMIRGMSTGIGFAIPSNLAREVSDKLIAEGKFTRAWLGVGTRPVKESPDFRELVAGVDDGVIVQSILPDSPAAKSDLRPGDVITAVDGRPISTTQQLRNEVRGKLGKTVTLEVFRDRKTFTLKIKPEEYLEPVFASAGGRSRGQSPKSSASSSGLGITVHAITPELADRFNVKAAEGVVVVAVEHDSPALRKGIRPGDIITSVNRQKVLNPTQFQEALDKADLKKGIIVNLQSADSVRFEILKEP